MPQAKPNHLPLTRMAFPALRVSRPPFTQAPQTEYYLTVKGPGFVTVQGKASAIGSAHGGISIPHFTGAAVSGVGFTKWIGGGPEASWAVGATYPTDDPGPQQAQGEVHLRVANGERTLLIQDTTRVLLTAISNSQFENAQETGEAFGSWKVTFIIRPQQPTANC